jgi:mannose-6-phosphate isomerase
LGKSVVERFGKEFPILIKFIDAKQDLSIQLHPNDDLAKKRHNSFGKTEMWYVMDADAGAELIVGFNKNVSKEEYSKSLEDDSLLDLLNYEPVKEGDTFFINTGKIHAIGAGVLLAEIQQTSDITYRVFDFNRKDKAGNLRELHTEMALDAIDFERKDDFKVVYDQTSDVTNNMVDSPYFKTNFLNLKKDLLQDTTSRDSFTIYMAVGGVAQIESDEGIAKISKGETVLVPAMANHIRVKTDGVKLLEVTI